MACIIRTADGSPLKYVPNARSATDATPTVVTLPAGRCQIDGQAEESDESNLPVLVPVVAEEGKTTIVRLPGSWKPTRSFSENQVVRLPDGQITGWLAKE
jgi:hypothetical protein